jgi:hypothetical protein
LRIYHPAARRPVLDGFYARFIRPGGLAFDIGAHVGDRAASFCRLGARVVAVEPQPALLRALRLVLRGADVVFVPSLLGAAGFAASAFLHTPLPGLLALTVAAVGDLGSRGPFWALPPRFLTGSALAAGIALINTMGAVGGFVGPYAVGLVKDFTGSFTGGLLLLSALLVVSAVATLALRRSAVLEGGG